ncbi:MAG: hypothetical protein P4M13_07875 [Alphaproteobacteria bacterium]|nr:hypothetical protein [Alphaproteobacteria bacterium]
MEDSESFVGILLIITSGKKRGINFHRIRLAACFGTSGEVFSRVFERIDYIFH